MQPFFPEYLQQLTDLHQGVLDAVQGLTSEALDWTPLRDTSNDMNSINMLVAHICGAERYWIGDVACGKPSGRVRSEEFIVRGMDAPAASAMIHAASQFAIAALEEFKMDDLEKIGTSPPDSRKVTVGWALLHALEHTAMHLGHIQITRQLWDENR